MVTSDYGSIYPAVQNLLLAVRAAGLGAALATLPLWSPWLVRRALHLTWRVTPCAIVPLGRPLGRNGPTTRCPVGAVVHLDRYGHQPFTPLNPARVVTRDKRVPCRPPTITHRTHDELS